MSETFINPYQTPQAEQFIVPTTPIWRVVGKTLMVTSGTRLPRICLETGETDGELVSVGQRVKKNSFLPMVLIALVAACLGYFNVLRAFYLIPSIFFAMIISSMIVNWKSTGHESKAGWFVSKSRFELKKKLQLVSYIMTLLTMASLTLMSYNGLTGWIALAVIYFNVYYFNRQKVVSLRGKQDGWISFNQIHPKALEYLIVNTAENVLPATQVKKVYDVHTYKWSFAQLTQGFRWNIFVWLVIPIAKLFKLKTLILPALTYESQKTISADKTPQSLRAITDEILKADATISYVVSELTETPRFNVEAYSNTFIKGDSTILCARYTTFAEPMACLSKMDVYAISMYEDGTFLFTSNTLKNEIEAKAYEACYLPRKHFSKVLEAHENRLSKIDHTKLIRPNLENVNELKRKMTQRITEIATKGLYFQNFREEEFTMDYEIKPFSV